MLNAKAFSIDDEDRASFQKAIEGLEEEMYQRQITTVRSTLIAVSILVLLSILASGCQTAKGITGDSGWILTKLSKNIQTEQE